MSDRIEKEPDDSALLQSLQKDSIPVVRGDWKVHLSSELQEGESYDDWELVFPGAVNISVCKLKSTECCAVFVTELPSPNANMTWYSRLSS